MGARHVEHEHQTGTGLMPAIRCAEAAYGSRGGVTPVPPHRTLASGVASVTPARAVCDIDVFECVHQERARDPTRDASGRDQAPGARA